jgi:hypothetical protein
MLESIELLKKLLEDPILNQDAIEATNKMIEDEAKHLQELSNQMTEILKK